MSPPYISKIDDQRGEIKVEMKDNLKAKGDVNLTNNFSKTALYLTLILTIILFSFSINSKFFTLIFNIKLNLIEIKEKERCRRPGAPLRQAASVLSASLAAHQTR